MQARCLGLGLGFAFVGVLPLRCSYQMSIPPLRMETGEIPICPNLSNHNSGIFSYLHPLRTNAKPFVRMGEEYETTSVTSLYGKWMNCLTCGTFAFIIVGAVATRKSKQSDAFPFSRARSICQAVAKTNLQEQR